MGRVHHELSDLGRLAVVMTPADVPENMLVLECGFELRGVPSGRLPKLHLSEVHGLLREAHVRMEVDAGWRAPGLQAQLATQAPIRDAQ
eukprot:7935138-Alexandrium_andersonii.AAC.1